jgi:hypothetical protein
MSFISEIFKFAGKIKLDNSEVFTDLDILIDK